MSLLLSFFMVVLTIAAVVVPSMPSSSPSAAVLVAQDDLVPQAMSPVVLPGLYRSKMPDGFVLTIGSDSPPTISMKYTVDAPFGATGAFEVIGYRGKLTNRTLLLTSYRSYPTCGAPYVLTYTLQNARTPTFRFVSASSCPTGFDLRASQEPQTFTYSGPSGD